MPIHGNLNQPETSASIGNTCVNSGISQLMGTSISWKIPPYRNLPKLFKELPDPTSWNYFRLIDSLVLRHPIICTEFNARPCNSVRYSWLHVFFMNQFRPSPCHFEFYFRTFLEIFAAQGAPPVSLTPEAKGKNLQQGKFKFFIWTPLGSRDYI